MSNYDDLKAKVQALLAAGQIANVPSREQRIDFAYLQDLVTEQMASAIKKLSSPIH